MMTQAFATEYYHWFFLIQPAPLPETLIGNSAEFYVRGRCREQDGITPEALAEYVRCYTPEAIHGNCEDYRAGATIDVEHAAADGEPRGGVPAAGAVGGARHGRTPVRRDERLAPARARRARTRAPGPSLPRRGAALTQRSRRSTRSFRRRDARRAVRSRADLRYTLRASSRESHETHCDQRHAREYERPPGRRVPDGRWSHRPHSSSIRMT